MASPAKKSSSATGSPASDPIVKPNTTQGGSDLPMGISQATRKDGKVENFTRALDMSAPSEKSFSEAK